MRISISIFILLIPSFLFCDDTIIDIKTIDNKDTMLITRSKNDFQFGACFGISLDKNSGDFLLPYYPDLEQNQSNPLQSFTSDWGYGIHLGLMAKYQINDYFGIGIKFHPLSFTSLDYQLSENQQHNGYSNSIAFNYFYCLLNPEFSLFLPETDFSISFGLILGKLFGTHATYITSFNNTSNISIHDEISIHPIDTYSAMAITLNYNLFYALIGNNTRLEASPFISFQHIPKIFETYSTHSTNNRINAGVSISFGFDKLQYDTIPYQEQENSFEQIATGKKEKIKFNQNINQQNNSMEINEIDVKIYEFEISESPPVDDYELDENTLEYLREFLHIYKNNTKMIMEIIINLPLLGNHYKIKRKKNAIIDYLKLKGVNENSIIQDEIKNKNIKKSRIEINIIY